MLTETLTDNATTVAKNVWSVFKRRCHLHFKQHRRCLNLERRRRRYASTGRTYIWKDAVNFFKLLGENEEFNAFQPISIYNINNDEVVGFGDMTATSKATGVTLTSDWVMHWKFNNEGKAVYFHDFFDTAAATWLQIRTKQEMVLQKKKIYQS